MCFISLFTVVYGYWKKMKNLRHRSWKMFLIGKLVRVCTTQKNGSHLCPFKLKSCNIGFLHLDVLICKFLGVDSNFGTHVFFYRWICGMLSITVFSSGFQRDLSPSTFCSVFCWELKERLGVKKLKLVLTCLVKILRLSVAIKCNLSPTINFKSEWRYGFLYNCSEICLIRNKHYS